jgi:hypothetical protein
VPPYRGANSAPIGVHWGFARGVAPAIVIGASSAGTPANHLGVSFDGGLTWAAATVPAPGGIGWFGVAYKPGFGALASSGNAGANSVVQSVDGLTWTAIAANNKTAGNWRRMVYSRVSDLFVQVGIGGVAGQRAQTSPDGLTWTLRPTPNLGGATSNQWAEIIECVSGRLLAVSGASFSPNVIASDDGGLTWAHAGAFPLGNDSALGMALGPAGLVRLTGGQTGLEIADYFSVDEGNSWTFVDASPPMLGQGVAVACNPDNGIVIRACTTGGGGMFRNTATGIPPGSPWVNVNASGSSNPSQGLWSPEWAAWLFVVSGGIVRRSDDVAGGSWVNINHGLFGALAMPTCVSIPFGT